MFKGIAVSKGIAIGRAYILDRSKLCILKQNINKNIIEEEVARLSADKVAAERQLSELAAKVQEMKGSIDATVSTLTEQQLDIERLNEEKERALASKMQEIEALKAEKWAAEEGRSSLV